MRRINIYIIAVLSILQFSCSEDEKMFFDGPNSVYFRLADINEDVDMEEDTLSYTFALAPSEITKKKIKIPVEISGYATNYDRKYHIKIQEYDNIKNGVHFEQLTEEQILPSGQVFDTLEIVFNRISDMSDNKFRVDINIVSGGDFVVGLKENLFASVRVSDILEEPTWWSKWRWYLGSFSRVRYLKWIEIAGDLSDLSGKSPSWWNAPQEMTLAAELVRYFEEYPEMESN